MFIYLSDFFKFCCLFLNSSLQYLVNIQSQTLVCGYYCMNDCNYFRFIFYQYEKLSPVLIFKKTYIRVKSWINRKKCFSRQKQRYSFLCRCKMRIFDKTHSETFQNRYYFVEKHYILLFALIILKPTDNTSQNIVHTMQIKQMYKEKFKEIVEIINF